MKHHFLLGLFALFFFGPVCEVNAQTDTPDPELSQLRELAQRHSINDSIGLTTRLNLARYWIYYNIDSSVHYIDQVVNHPRKEELLSATDRCMHLLVKGWTFQGLRRPVPARKWMTACYDCAVESENEDLQLGTLTNIVSTFADELSPVADSMALDVLGKLDTSRGQNHQELQAYTMMVRARIAEEKGETERAVKLALETLNLPVLQIKEFAPKVKPGVLSLLGSLAKKQNNYFDALDFYRMGLAEEPANSLSRGWILTKMSDAFLRLNQMDSAKFYLEELKAIPQENPDCHHETWIRAAIATRQKNYEQALEFLKQENCKTQQITPRTKINQSILKLSCLLQLNRFDEISSERGLLADFIGKHPTAMSTDYKQALAEIDLRLKLREVSPTLSQRFSDYVKKKNDEYEESSNEMTAGLLSKFASRIRQDSIANLTLRSAAAEAEVTARQKQLWLTLALLAAVAAGMFFAIREARRRRKLSEELKLKNNRITWQNAETNHRTNHYLTSIIRMLREQQYKMQEVNADTKIINDLERQTLVYTKLQSLLFTDKEKTVVNLKTYFKKLLEMVEESHAVAGDPLQLEAAIDELVTEPDLAGPLAQIVNELITNSVKYARRTGGVVRARFSCKLEPEGILLVRYEDDGTDAEVDTSGRYSSESGLELIEELTVQLEGEREKTEGYGYVARFEL